MSVSTATIATIDEQGVTLLIDDSTEKIKIEDEDYVPIPPS